MALHARRTTSAFLNFAFHALVNAVNHGIIFTLWLQFTWSTAIACSAFDLGKVV